jgi:hypothetical protein
LLTQAQSGEFKIDLDDLHEIINELNDRQLSESEKIKFESILAFSLEEVEKDKASTEPNENVQTIKMALINKVLFFSASFVLVLFLNLIASIYESKYGLILSVY